MTALTALSRGEGRIGKYRLVGVLSEGKTARLYLAVQTGVAGFEKVVALKCVLPHLASSPEFRQIFLHEAIIAARLEHSNIVTTYDLFEFEGQFFVSMEYLAGEDLATILEVSSVRGPLPIPLIAEICQRTADALQYAHRFIASDGQPICIVHRNVTPAKIFVTYQGDVKLTDFGIAKIRGNPSRSRTRTPRGRWAYTAPELFSGGTLDARTDVYSLGVVLWECVTGRKLFDSGSSNDGTSGPSMPAGASPSSENAVHEMAPRQLIPPSKFRADLPSQLEAIILRALAEDRKHRFQSAAELCEALEQFRDDSAARTLGAWLESQFGSERAQLKRAIAQGLELDRNLVQLRRVCVPSPSGRGRPRLAWSTHAGGGSSIHPTPLPGTLFAAAEPSVESGDLPIPLKPPERVTQPPITQPPVRVPPRSDTLLDAPIQSLDDPTGSAELQLAPDARPVRAPRWAIYLSVAFAAAAAAAVIQLRPSGQPSAAATATRGGELTIESEPPGAHVLLDGEPTGMVTPTTLRELPLGKSFEVRIAKPGFAAGSQSFKFDRPETQSHHFRLSPSVGIVRFEVASKRAIVVYVDGNEIELGRPIELAIGEHAVRVESGMELISSRTIEVVAGEQTIRADAPEK